MRTLIILAVLTSVYSIQPWDSSSITGSPGNIHAESETKEEHHQGSLTAVTTRNMWISKDNRNNTWVIDVEGTPRRRYVVDTPAQKEISHYETVQHDAVTHQEPVYSTRKVWYVDYPTAPTVLPRETYYNYDDALTNAGAKDGVITEGSERYISSYKTVVDKEAYTERVKVIDQYARKEVGHYETDIVGEVGHWEQGKEENIGKGDGGYVSQMTRSGAEE